MEKLPDKVDSKFRFVLLAAKRAQQIIRGARPKITEPGQKPTRVAIEELDAGLIPWQYGPPPQEESAEEAAPAGEETPLAAEESEGS